MKSRFAVAACAAVLACNQGQPNEPDSRANVDALFAVPATDVNCIELTATGATRAVTRHFEVAGGQSTAHLVMNGIPSGNVLFSGNAFAESCSDVTSASVPTWNADSTNATVTRGGSPVTVTIPFRPNGRADVGADFIGDVFTVTTLAGRALVQGSADGAGTAATFGGPNGLALDGTSLYVADRTTTGPGGSGTITGNTIRKIDVSTGVVTTLAGSATAVGNSDGPGATARFVNLHGLAMLGSDVLIADRCAIRRMSAAPPFTVTTVFGTPIVTGGTQTFNCAPVLANFDIAVRGTDVYVADGGASAVWKVSLATTPPTVTVAAGIPGSIGANDGTLATARFNLTSAVVFPFTTDDIFFVADLPSGSPIRRVSRPGNTVTTVAGSSIAAASIVDGVGTDARFLQARRFVSDGSSLFIGDTASIRRMDLATSAVVTIAGGNTAGSADGVGTAATLAVGSALARSSAGVIYVADQVNFNIRVLTP